MIEFIIFLLILGVSVYVMEPFFSGKKFQDRFSAGKEAGKAGLTARIEILTDNIGDLELEYQTGMIPENDYKRILTDYKSQISILNREMSDSPSGVHSLDDQIENDIILLRKSSAGSGNETLICPECKKTIDPGSNFCSNCGTGLGE